MAKMRKQLVLLSEINVSFFVRTGINNGHVTYLQGLIESGVELPPLEIAEGTMDLIDGRHRLIAYLNLGYTEVLCNVRKYESKEAMIIAALKANVGGALPPGPKDISHVIECLLARGATRASIIRQIGEQIGFPSALVRRYLDDIQSNIARRRLAEAVSAIVSDDMSLKDAAEQFGVDVETLRAEISGKPKVESRGNIAGIMTRLRAKFTTFNHSVGGIMTNILNDLRDGLISERDAKTVIDYYAELLQGYETKEKQWKKRFDNLFEIQSVNNSLPPKKRAAKKKRVPNTGSKNGAQKALEQMGLA